MDDLLKLERDLKRLEKFPTRVLTAAVKKGAKSLLLLEAKKNAPKGKTLNLSNALITIMEKSKTTGKRVAQVTFDRKYNDKLAKISKTGERSYYPVSQEYGWTFHKDKSPKSNGRKRRRKKSELPAVKTKSVDGLFYLKNAADANSSGFKSLVTSHVMEEINKIWKGKG